MTDDKYSALGASATKDGLHDLLSSSGLLKENRLFAPVLPDLSGDSEFASIIHCDGAGTKSITPYLYFKDTGKRDLFAGLAQDAIVMNLDDIYCIGSPESLILANTIGRNARLIDDESLGVLINSYKALCEELAQLGVPIAMSGGETADCGDVVRTLMVDAVICGRIAKRNLIYADQIKAGDAIVGFESCGQASYESQVNSGIGSNGLTLARHSLLSSYYRETYPECCDPDLNPEHAYRGPFKTTDTEDTLGMNIGEALSSPTRTYAPVLAELYKSLGGVIHGVIHLTGGAHTKALRFGRGCRIIKDTMLPVPPIFGLIQEHGKVSWEEMYKVFNMGQRLEIYLPAEHVQEVVSLSKKFGISAQQVGHVETHPNGPDAANSALLKTEYGEFNYDL